MKPKKSKKSRARSSEDELLSSDNENYTTEELNIDVPLEPIGAFMKDRSVMVKNMFSSITRSQMKSILPEILKNTSIDELETLCIDELGVMSKKRIQFLIEGQEMTSSSSSEESDSATKAIGTPGPVDSLFNESADPTATENIPDDTKIESENERFGENELEFISSDENIESDEDDTIITREDIETTEMSFNNNSKSSKLIITLTAAERARISLPTGDDVMSGDDDVIEDGEISSNQDSQSDLAVGRQIKPKAVPKRRRKFRMRADDEDPSNGSSGSELKGLRAAALKTRGLSAIPDLPPARTNEVPVSKWKYAPSKEALEMINDWYVNGIMNPKVLLERKKQCPLPEHQAFMVPELDSSVDTHVTTLRRSGIDANVSRFYDETLKDNLRRLIPIFGPLTIGAQHARNGTLTNEKAYDMFLRAGEFAAQAQFHMNFQRRVNILHGTKIRNKDNVKLCNNNWPDYATSSDVPPLMGPDLMKIILEETSVLAKNSRALVQAANMQRMPTHGPVLQAPNFKHQRNKPYSSEVQVVYQQRGGQYGDQDAKNPDSSSGVEVQLLASPGKSKGKMLQKSSQRKRINSPPRDSSDEDDGPTLSSKQQQRRSPRTPTQAQLRVRFQSGEGRNVAPWIHDKFDQMELEECMDFKDADPETKSGVRTQSEGVYTRGRTDALTSSRWRDDDRSWRWQHDDRAPTLAPDGGTSRDQTRITAESPPKKPIRGPQRFFRGEAKADSSASDRSTSPQLEPAHKGATALDDLVLPETTVEDDEIGMSPGHSDMEDMKQTIREESDQVVEYEMIETEGSDDGEIKVVRRRKEVKSTSVSSSKKPKRTNRKKVVIKENDFTDLPSSVLPEIEQPVDPTKTMPTASVEDDGVVVELPPAAHGVVQPVAPVHAISNATLDGVPDVPSMMESDFTSVAQSSVVENDVSIIQETVADKDSSNISSMESTNEKDGDDLLLEPQSPPLLEPTSPVMVDDADNQSNSTDNEPLEPVSPQMPTEELDEICDIIEADLHPEDDPLFGMDIEPNSVCQPSDMKYAAKLTTEVSSSATAWSEQPTASNQSSSVIKSIDALEQYSSGADDDDEDGEIDKTNTDELVPPGLEERALDIPLPIAPDVTMEVVSAQSELIKQYGLKKDGSERVLPIKAYAQALKKQSKDANGPATATQKKRIGPAQREKPSTEPATAGPSEPPPQGTITSNKTAGMISTTELDSGSIIVEDGNVKKAPPKPPKKVLPKVPSNRAQIQAEMRKKEKEMDALKSKRTNELRQLQKKYNSTVKTVIKQSRILRTQVEEGVLEAQIKASEERRIKAKKEKKMKKKMGNFSMEAISSGGESSDEDGSGVDSAGTELEDEPSNIERSPTISPTKSPLISKSRIPIVSPTKTLSEIANGSAVVFGRVPSLITAPMEFGPHIPSDLDLSLNVSSDISGQRKVMVKMETPENIESLLSAEVNPTTTKSARLARKRQGNDVTNESSTSSVQSDRSNEGSEDGEWHESVNASKASDRLSRDVRLPTVVEPVRQRGVDRGMQQKWSHDRFDEGPPPARQSRQQSSGQYNRRRERQEDQSGNYRYEIERSYQPRDYGRDRRCSPGRQYEAQSDRLRARYEEEDDYDNQLGYGDAPRPPIPIINPLLNAPLHPGEKFVPLGDPYSSSSESVPQGYEVSRHENELAEDFEKRKRHHKRKVKNVRKETSSSSSSGSELPEQEKKQKKRSKPKKEKIEKSKSKKSRKNMKSPEKHKPSEAALKTKLIAPKVKEEEQQNVSKEATQGREMLELELRARAIKALMKISDRP